MMRTTHVLMGGRRKVAVVRVNVRRRMIMRDNVQRMHTAGRHRQNSRKSKNGDGSDVKAHRQAQGGKIVKKVRPDVWIMRTPIPNVNGITAI